MKFQKEWYEDTDVKEMINKIENVMQKYNIDKMKFESDIEIMKYIYNFHKEQPDEYTQRLGMSTPCFHLEFQEGRIQIDL